MRKALTAIAFAAGFSLLTSGQSVAAIPLVPVAATISIAPEVQQVQYKLRLHGQTVHRQHHQSTYFQPNSLPQLIYNPPRTFNPLEYPEDDYPRYDYPGYGLYR